jgi:hypothetical protein
MDIIHLIKSRRMKWAGHVPHMGEREKFIESFVGKI